MVTETLANRADLPEEAEVQDELLRLIVQSEIIKNGPDIKRIIQILLRRGDYLQATRWLAFQDDLSSYRAEDLLQLNQLFPRPFLNIGGGPSFLYPMWENLDGVVGPLNPRPFMLGADIRLPFKADSFELVYTSHALEHLDDSTVQTLLAEARRVLRPSAALLIKIPDYDALIDAWKSKHEDYFRDELWNFGAVTPTYANRSVNNNLLTKAAYIFCGFWNSQYGNLFDACDPFAVGAYNGPAPMPENDMIAVMRLASPHEIAAKMRNYIVATEKNFTFNHQNAWGRSEMTDLIRSAGFDLISADKHKIVERFNYVPRISQMFEISAVFLATPRR